MTDDIWAGDHLNRKEDAQFLTAYLLQRNELAVVVGDKGTSINVSAQWGAGKTFFLTRLARQLREDGYRVAEVNAWRDDHADDPIFAVMSAVLKALGKGTRSAKVGRTLLNSAGKIAVRALKGGVKKAAAIVIDKDDVDGIADDLARVFAEAGEETIGEFADKALERFEDGQKAIDNFRSELAKGVKGQKPLFVLVDELDRCRPTYAVSLLERIKHLFDVPNVIFVFGTHSDQLTHTIRSVYGIGFDADRYLHRFFDTTYQFDSPKTVNFVQAKWDALQFKDARFVEIHGTSQQACIAKIADNKRLSLRDIDQCMDALWTITGQLDPRVPVPLLYLFPLVVAYHLRLTDVFEFGAGEPARASLRQDEIQAFYDGSEIYSRQIYSRTSQNHIWQTMSLSPLISAFRSLLANGLNQDVASDNLGYSYAERYRDAEFRILHSSMSRGEKVPTILESYGSMIRRVGRIGATPENDEGERR